jgi:hypothetical protein
MNESELSVRQIVAVLNDAVALDAHAMQTLVEKRVPCNSKMAHSPTIQCSDDQLCFTVGMLGILNAIAAVDGELIEAAYDDYSKKLIRFQLRTKDES